LILSLLISPLIFTNCESSSSSSDETATTETADNVTTDPGTTGPGTTNPGTTTPVISIPAEPSSATVTAGNAQLSLSWSAISGATSYEVWYGTSSSSSSASKFGSDVTVTSAVVTGLTNGTLYYIWLKAKNSAGTSGFGTVASETTSTPVSLTMVSVTGGTFQRDSTSTNTSTVTAFRMSAKEITRAQFVAIMGNDPSNTTYSSGTTDPVQKVNWYHAIAFCNKLSIAEGFTRVYNVSGFANDAAWTSLAYASIPTTSNSTWNAATCNWSANGYRLPTEMEWMWAAMGASGGTNGYLKAFAGSTGSNAIGDYAWYDSNSSNKTHPAGVKLPNEFGLYDMSGNVREWCWDWYGMYPVGAQTDYRGAASGTDRVVPNGSYFNIADFVAVAYRLNYYPDLQSSTIGFRVVRP